MIRLQKYLDLSQRQLMALGKLLDETFQTDTQLQDALIANDYSVATLVNYEAERYTKQPENREQTAMRFRDCYLRAKNATESIERTKPTKRQGGMS